MVVPLNPIADDATGMLQCFEARAMDALLFERPNDALDHSVLFRGVRRDELLLQSVAADECGVVSTTKDQPIVRTEEERLWHTPQCPEPRN